MPDVDSLFYLQEIYLTLDKWNSLANLITGCIQVAICVCVLYALYRLFNLFF